MWNTVPTISDLTLNLSKINKRKEEMKDGEGEKERKEKKDRKKKL